MFKSLHKKTQLPPLKHADDEARRPLLDNDNNHTIVQISDTPNNNRRNFFLPHDILTVIYEFLVKGNDILALRLMNKAFLDAFHSSPESKIRIIEALFKKANAENKKNNILPNTMIGLRTSSNISVNLPTLPEDKQNLKLSTLLAEIVFFSTTDTLDEENIKNKKNLFMRFHDAFNNIQIILPNEDNSLYKRTLKIYLDTINDIDNRLRFAIFTLYILIAILTCISLVNGGTLLITTSGVYDCSSSSYGSNNTNDQPTISCDKLRRLPQNATWPSESTYSCFQDSSFEPSSISEIIKNHCDKYENVCSSLLKAAFFSLIGHSKQNTGVSSDLIGEYCSTNLPKLTPFFFIIIFTATFIFILLSIVLLKIRYMISNQTPTPPAEKYTLVPNALITSLNRLFKARKAHLDIDKNRLQNNSINWV